MSLSSKSQGQFPGGGCGCLVTARDTLTAWRAYRLRTRLLRAIISSAHGVDRMYGAYEKGVRLPTAGSPSIPDSLIS